MRLLTLVRDNFLLGSLLAALANLILLGSAAILILRFPIQSRVHNEAVKDAVANFQPTALRMLTPQQVAQPLAGAAYDQVNQIVRDSLHDVHVSRIKIWNRAGVVTYSTLPSQVGETAHSDLFQKALLGEVAWELNRSGESMADRELGQTIEVYIPLSWQQGSTPGAVAELFVSYAGYAETLAIIRNAILVATFEVGILVAIFAYLTYRSRWRAIQREKDTAIRRSQEMEALAKVANSLNQLGSRDQRVLSVMLQILQVSGADSAQLYLPEGKDGELRLETSVVSPETPWRPVPLATGKDSLTSQAFKLGVTVMAENYADDSDASPAYDYRSGIALPIKTNGNVIAVLSLNSVKSKHFTPDRARLLTVIADNLGALLEQARLQDALRQELDRERQRMATLQEVVQRLALEANPNHALWSTVECARFLADAQYGILHIWDQTGNLVSSVFTGMSPEERTLFGDTPQCHGLPMVDCEATRPIRVQDLASPPSSVGLPPNHPAISALLGVPVPLKNGNRGALYLANKKDGREFTEEDEQALSLVASLAAVLVDNFNLYQTIAAERSTLAAIQESIVEGLVVLDSQGRELYRNRALGQLTGMADAETLGRPLSEILEERADYFFEDRKDYEALMAAVRNVRSGPASVVVVMKNPRHRVLSATVFPIDVLGDETMSGLLLRDVTEEREVERRRDAFVSIASHELRTPMTTIVGFAELLRDRNPSPAMRSDWLDRIINEGHRLTAILEDMLNVSRIQSGKLAAELEPLGVGDVIANVVGMLQPTTTNHHIKVSVSPGIPAVFADKDKLVQVLVNLMSNAIKYSPKGGEVVANACYYTDDDQIVISVQDHGLGIAPEDQERLFTTFSRIRRPETDNIRGTGLGLYIVKSLVELMHGRIWLESELNKGSTFYVALPADASLHAHTKVSA